MIPPGYRTYLAFCPNQENRGRKNGLGVWRVELSVWATVQRGKRVERRGRFVCLSTVRPYRRGVIVNPTKLALDYERGTPSNLQL